MESVAKLRVKVVPGASRSEVVGWLGELLKVRVSAPPEKGRANAAVIRLLAGELQLRERSLSIASGGTSQLKIVEIRGLNMRDVRKLIDAGAT